MSSVDHGEYIYSQYYAIFNINNGGGWVHLYSFICLSAGAVE